MQDLSMLQISNSTGKAKKEQVVIYIKKDMYEAEHNKALEIRNKINANGLAFYVALCIRHFDKIYGVLTEIEKKAKD